MSGSLALSQRRAAVVVGVGYLLAMLAPINRHLVLYAVLLRMVGETVAVKMAVEGTDALRLLGTAKYPNTLTPEQLATPARLALASHSSTYAVVFLFLGLGSAVFARLWLRSRYVPGILGMLGIFASLLLSAGSIAFLIEPRVQRVIYPWYMIPMFFFEVGIGLWLLIRGLTLPNVEDGTTG